MEYQEQATEIQTQETLTEIKVEEKPTEVKEKKKKMNPPDPMKNEQEHLTYEQIKAIIDACDNMRDKALLVTLAKTGRRVSEVVKSLKVSDIDFDKGIIYFRILKKRYNKKEMFYVDKEVLDVLNEYLKTAELKNDNVFDITRQRVDQIFKKLCYSVGITKIGDHKPHVHVLRHSYAIEYAKRASNPADIVQLKNHLAHSKLETTMFYLRFRRDWNDVMSKMWEGRSFT
jgi:integrase/recombinase XerD